MNRNKFPLLLITVLVLCSLAFLIRTPTEPTLITEARALQAKEKWCDAEKKWSEVLEKFGESGDFALASDALPKVTAAFEAVRPALRRFCSGG